MSEKTPIPEAFLKPYDPQATESLIYDAWEKSGYFNPDNLPGERTEPFTIIMPPPNANGSLHAGHALFVTLEDIMIRFARMQGKKALWVPGADHAGFETQTVYEKKLEKEGRTRFGMDPKELYQEILDFTLANKSFMEGQIRQLGASCDWSRERFTLDADIVKIVYATFTQLNEDGLLYRGNRIVNWCPKHQTSLSNLETTYMERTDPFYYFQYGPFVIGTARPETKFGDKYVVVHPDDVRYKDFAHGEQITLEWINGPITATVIKDEASDPEMGSGAMTITPYHSAIDFEIAKRHNLDGEQIIDWRGKLLPIAGEFAGMNIMEARQKIVEKLKEKGLLVRVEEAYQHSVPVCYKCEREIEPQVRPQWFVKTKPLAEKALAALDSGETVALTEQHEKVLRHWLSTIEDWNISRQIVWGIPIPAWFKGDESLIQEECPGEGWERDTDTFDTWFSSGQWPFAALGFPDDGDFKHFYPTSVMETGADILFFWVARMMMLGIYRTGKSPFKHIYLHGLVRDKHGKKMSKSKGNVISPIEVTEKYGTDALRMALVVGNTPGTDMNLDPDKVNAYRKFANKLWNITRFILDATTDKATVDATTPRDTEILSELATIAAEVTEHLEKFQFHLASEKLYHYVWHELADKILEESKPILTGDDGSAKAARQATLHTCLTTSLKLLHPFMPFVTETIWQNLPQKEADFLMVAEWPAR